VNSCMDQQEHFESLYSTFVEFQTLGNMTISLWLSQSFNISVITPQRNATKAHSLCVVVSYVRCCELEAKWYLLEGSFDSIPSSLDLSDSTDGDVVHH
jgi:hypothetical protein